MQNVNYRSVIGRHHSDRVTCIAAHINSSLLASGSADGNVHLCDIMTGEKLNCLLPSSPPRGMYVEHSLLHLNYWKEAILTVSFNFDVLTQICQLVLKVFFVTMYIWLLVLTSAVYTIL